ncbi:MAG: MFS transporter [Acidiferrobacteraceae bacterium]|nr:MFS transporter [Acidiferrobacteraceae bacterium]
MFDDPLTRRNVFLLAICLALMLSATSLVITTSALVGVILAPKPIWATVPLAFMFLGSLICAFPASLLMRQVGRRAGFSFGLTFGLLGAIMSAFAVIEREFGLLCLGALFIGCFNGFGQFYRFAAADVAGEIYRARAISLVIAGGVIAALIGPTLANWSKDSLIAYPFAGSYICLVGLYLLSLILVSFLRIPKLKAEQRDEKGRLLMRIALQPVFIVAALGAVSAYGVMNLVMTSTPLAMATCGYSFSQTTFVFQGHMLGMYAPSFFTGHLIQRYGVTKIMFLGALLLAICILVNMHGETIVHFWMSLVLLGVGWNFLFIGGTTLVLESYHPAEKAKTQGLNDVLVFGTVAITALSSGVLHQSVGWFTLNLSLLPVIFLTIIMVGWLHYVRPPKQLRT